MDEESFACSRDPRRAPALQPLSFRGARALLANA